MQRVSLCVCVSGVTALLVKNQGCGRGGRVSPLWENKEGGREIAEREENASFCDREVEEQEERTFIIAYFNPCPH